MYKDMLDLYSDYLISSFGATTAMGLSKLMGGEIGHDEVTQWLSHKAQTSVSVNLRLKLLIVKPIISLRLCGDM